MAGYEKGLDRVLDNIRAMGQREKAKLVEAAVVIGGTLLVDAKANASLTDHSQEDLDSMGNPYSTRLPKGSGPHPDAQVHIQSGLLYENIEHDILVTGDRIMVSVGVDETAVPYIADLIEGTSKMRPRDFLTDTLNQNKHKVGAVVRGVIGPNGG